MAGITRFYNPSFAKYQSMFVPTELPVDLMVGALGAKQAQADKQAIKDIELGNWTQEALPGFDTKHVQGIKDELSQYSAESMKEDKTSPEYQRKYLNLVNKIKNDKGLEQVAGSVANYKTMTARRKALKEKGDNAWSPEMEADYQYRFNEYTKEDGKGFTGDIQLGDPNILEGKEHFTEAIKIFEHINADSNDFVKSLADGTSYKNGFEGITNQKVKREAERLYDSWMQLDAGKQDYQRELQKRGYVDSTFNALPKEERDKINNEITKSTQNNFLDVGRTIVYGKTDTGLAEAKNKELAYKRKQEEKFGSPAVTTVDGAVKVVNDAITRDKNIAQYKKDIDRYQGIVDNGNATAGQRKWAAEQSALTNTSLANEKMRKNADWNRTIDKHLNTNEGKLAEKKVLNLSNEQLQLINQIQDKDLKYELMVVLDNKNSLGDYLGSKNNLKAAIKSKLDQYAPHSDPNSDYPSVSTNPAVSILQKLDHLESKKENSMKVVKENFKKDHQSQYINDNSKWVHQDGIIVNSKSSPTVKAIESDVQGNPDGYEIFTNTGKPIPMSDISKDNKFKVSQVSAGKHVLGDDVGFGGSLVVMEDYTDAKGIVKQRPKTVFVTAIPRTSNKHINRNSLANDFLMLAEHAPDKTSADVYKSQAAKITNFDINTAFQKLSMDEENKGTSVNVTAPNGQKIVAILSRTDPGKSSDVKEGQPTGGGGYKVSIHYPTKKLTGDLKKDYENSVVRSRNGDVIEGVYDNAQDAEAYLQMLMSLPK